MRDTRNRESRYRDIRNVDDRLDETVAEVTGRVFRQLNRIFGIALAPHDLSTVEANLVTRIWLRGPMKIGVLQKHMAMSSSTFTGALDRAERAGLLRRTRDPEDRRATILQAAPWPQRRQQAVKASLLAAEEELLEPLSAKERRQLHRLLKKVADSHSQ